MVFIGARTKESFKSLFTLGANGAIYATPKLSNVTSLCEITTVAMSKPKKPNHPPAISIMMRIRLIVPTWLGTV